MVCKENGKPGFKYGNSGKCYTYEPGSESGRNNAKRKAIMQGAAISNSTGEKLVVKDKPTQTLTFKLSKEKSTYNDEQHLVFGWGYEAIKKTGEQVIDHSKQFVDEGDSLKELELATYAFNIGSGKIGFGHVGKAKGYVAECMFFTKEKNVALGLAEDAIPQGTWLGVWFPDEKDYQTVKKMKAPMFSLEGYGFLEEVD